MENQFKNKAFFFFLITILFIMNSHLQAYEWKVGEEFVYRVKWMHFRIATVKLQVLGQCEINGHEVYHTSFKIDSNPVLFFINIHSSFESYIDKQCRPHLYVSSQKNDGVGYQSNYAFDYATDTIKATITNQEDTTKVIEKMVPLDGKVYDGVSLIFYLRSVVHQEGNEELFAFVNGEKKRLSIEKRGQGKKMRVKPVHEPFQTYEINGKAHFTSIAGVNGKFRAWFAIDDQVPPLAAHFKVFLGEVKMSLESWNNWNSTL